MTAEINIPAPDLQIAFSFDLAQIRRVYLQDALSNTINDLDLTTLDLQLKEYVPQDSLKILAKRGLRGELVFPVPCILETNPFMLGYYRLLLGFSKKEFYTAKFGVSSFKAMEEKGNLSEKNRAKIPALCKGMIGSVCALLDGINSEQVSKDHLDDLTLLTVGPQLRGGTNVKKGVAGIKQVFATIHKIVQHSASGASESDIKITNAAGRTVIIRFAPDPDIVIYEKMNATTTRNVIAIEVKGGTDFSNIHNRMGEAEKSHQKAKSNGYAECWTVVNVDNINMEIAQKESPSTNRFYRLSSLNSGEGKEYEDFKNRIIGLTGIMTN